MLPEDDEGAVFAPGREIDYLIWTIRRSWGVLFRKYGPTDTADLIGILGTLLNSIEAHAWNTGASKGYVAFLVSFMESERGRSARATGK